jgi:hypothetical protein
MSDLPIPSNAALTTPLKVLLRGVTLLLRPFAAPGAVARMTPFLERRRPPPPPQRPMYLERAAMAREMHRL